MPQTDDKTLLSIIEFGGYPDFTALYQQAGFTVSTVNSLRQGLSSLRKQKPHVIVAEFVYGPVYGSRISNLESLFAGLQKHAPDARLIVFLDKEHAEQFARLKDRFPVFDTLYFPIDAAALQRILARIAATV